MRAARACLCGVVWEVVAASQCYAAREEEHEEKEAGKSPTCEERMMMMLAMTM